MLRQCFDTQHDRPWFVSSRTTLQPRMEPTTSDTNRQNTHVRFFHEPFVRPWFVSSRTTLKPLNGTKHIRYKQAKYTCTVLLFMNHLFGHRSCFGYGSCLPRTSAMVRVFTNHFTMFYGNPNIAAMVRVFTNHFTIFNGNANILYMS